ncbi:unnamed protein product [Ambrosiozyma monospora]|uniref:Unnamed protein product n=1 Tax=Ambrosiozyma monospora TaxID=43982 RepID=A0ACB5U3N0_AMBMO|nr:unnamed protein product [Ambrosiozyma monospora]
MSIIIINTLFSSLVYLTVGILALRIIWSMVNNKTMIESWELERIEEQFYTGRFWFNIRSNFAKIYPGKPFPKLSSWKLHYRSKLSENSLVPYDFSYDDFVFPYSCSLYTNMVSAMGPIYQWFWPWGGPSGDGIHFERNTEDEDQLQLPFPPDGADFEPNVHDAEVSSTRLDSEDVIKTWSNGLGETLTDFGVDLETENIETYKHK